ncbi:oligosaccharide flippase family protein [Daejeonella sp. JGW-45]|uniref:oligosaccharide flippase family protein n=1 Tax=Daejeonella sp. JGW-45 TaxID=3034148 RepID=UPI0023EC1228|nr:oligosaccharide flippase family protein [Daejeonella sp. JGW-45]
MKDSVVFGGLNALSKFFSLFLTPLFTSLLSKADYGIMDLLNPLMSISGTIIILGMDSAVARFYYQTDNVKERKQVVSNGFWAQIISSIFVVGFILCFKTIILTFYLKHNYNASQDLYLQVMAGIILLSTPIRFVQNLLIWTYEKKKYAVLTGGFVILNFLSIVGSMYVFRDKLLAVFIGQLFPGIIFAIMSLVYIRGYLLPKINWILLKDMMKFGLPLVLLALIPALIPALDRSFINKFSGLEEVANYGIGYRIATLIALPISSISTALGPFILGLHKEENAERLFNIISYAIILLVSTLIIFLVTLSPLIIKILASRHYMPGIVVVAPLSFYFLLDMLKGICASGIDLSMKTYWNLMLYPVGLLFLYMALATLTPLYGIIGAAIALFLSALINFNLFTLVGRRLYPFKYNQLKMSFLVLFAFFMSFALSLNFENSYYYAYGAILLVIFPICGFMVFISRDQRESLKIIVKQQILKRNIK